MAGVHAITDVTGFGLAGHALELARGAKLGVTIEWSKVPLLAGVARDGAATASSPAHRAATGPATASRSQLDAGLPPVARDLLTDPQTSGGLLVSCDAGERADVLALFRAQGFDAAAVIGSVRAGVGLRVAG